MWRKTTTKKCICKLPQSSYLKITTFTTSSFKTAQNSTHRLAFYYRHFVSRLSSGIRMRAKSAPLCIRVTTRAALPSVKLIGHFAGARITCSSRASRYLCRLWREMFFGSVVMFRWNNLETKGQQTLRKLRLSAT